MLKRDASALRTRAQGFSLIELMVALVVGLIVIGAVIALVMSIIRSNNQTILATRLTQEMRATMAVIAADIRRARGVDDPFQMTAPGANPFALVHPDIAGLPSLFLCRCGGRQLPHRERCERRGVAQCGAAEPAVLHRATAEFGVRHHQPAHLHSGRAFRPAEMSVGAAVCGDPARVACRAHPEIQRTLTQTVFTRSIAGN